MPYIIAACIGIFCVVSILKYPKKKKENPSWLQKELNTRLENYHNEVEEAKRLVEMEKQKKEQENEV